MAVHIGSPSRPSTRAEVDSATSALRVALYGSDGTLASSSLNTFFHPALPAAPTSVKAAAGRLHSFQAQNPGGSDCWLQVFDAATGSVTPGTTTPKLAFWLPAGGSNEGSWTNGIAFSAAITILAAATATGAAAPTTAPVVDVEFV